LIGTLSIIYYLIIYYLLFFVLEPDWKSCWKRDKNKKRWTNFPMFPMADLEDEKKKYVSYIILKYRIVLNRIESY